MVSGSVSIDKRQLLFAAVDHSGVILVFLPEGFTRHWGTSLASLATLDVLLRSFHLNFLVATDGGAQWTSS